MTNDEFRQFVRQTASTNSSLLVAVLGLCNEAGELADIVNKAVLQQRDPDREKLISDLGDALWYIVHCADLLGTSLEEVMSLNVAKLTHRYALNSE